jgi:hypothetical protein
MEPKFYCDFHNNLHFSLWWVRWIYSPSYCAGSFECPSLLSKSVGSPTLCTHTLPFFPPLSSMCNGFGWAVLVCWLETSLCVVASISALFPNSVWQLQSKFLFRFSSGDPLGSQHGSRVSIGVFLWGHHASFGRVWFWCYELLGDMMGQADALVNCCSGLVISTIDTAEGARPGYLNLSMFVSELTL